MANLLMERRGHSLWPIDEPGQDVVSRLPQREYVKVNVTRPRNLAHHRKFFAMLNLVFANQDKYDQFNHFFAALKIGLGHCETVVLGNGAVTYLPKSISFSKMDQTEFDKFYNDACDLVARRFLPTVTSSFWDDRFIWLLHVIVTP